MRYFLIFLAIAFLLACSRNDPAPVFNAWLQPQAQSSDYIVSKGDTIYSIAWEFGLDYSALVQANHLKPPYSIYPGQHLKMTNVARGSAKPLMRQPQPVKSPAKIAVITYWHWPASGKIIQRYSLIRGGNSGIDIAGRLGSPVRAAASGEIVYCGNGIRGYGNLIIIKHNRHYLSAYAYNQRILVRLGQQVNAGQALATMGHDDAGQVMLHFEIRYDGQPVDPLNFLR